MCREPCGIAEEIIPGANFGVVADKARNQGTRDRSDELK
jgi:hypothetical protein